MKTVAVTGSNRGLGLEFCRQYLVGGARVLACCRHPEVASELKALKADYSELHIFPLDVSSESSIGNFADLVAQEKFEIDLLINNAGVSIDEAFGHWTHKTISYSFAVNSTGPAMLTQSLYQHLNKDSKVVFLSSGLGSIEENINPDGPYDPYAMSKATLSVLCRRLATKSLDKTVVFTAISPGWVKTGMGGPEAPTTPTEAVQDMIKVIEKLDAESNGRFLNATGAQIPW